MSDKAIRDLLERYPEGIPNHTDTKPLTKSKKKAVGIVMPSLSLAMEELYRRLLKADSSLRNHPALRRQWAPAVCRLIELDYFHHHPK